MWVCGDNAVTCSVDKLLLEKKAMIQTTPQPWSDDSDGIQTKESVAASRGRAARQQGRNSEESEPIVEKRYIRVVHGSHFRAIFGSFSLFIFLPFFKNELKNETKMIIFEKSNPSLAFAKMIIFTFIFTLHFCCSFKPRSDA